MPVLGVSLGLAPTVAKDGRPYMNMTNHSSYYHTNLSYPILGKLSKWPWRRGGGSNQWGYEFFLYKAGVF